MEPPAVNVGLGFQRSGSSLEKNRRDIMLRIDSPLTNYASTSHAFDELPDNFLETISPQQGTCSLELNTNHVQNDLDSSTLSPGISDQRYTSENVDILPHLSDQSHGIGSGLLTTSSVEDLGESRRTHYIKEEYYLPGSYEEEDELDLNRHSPISLQNDLTALNSENHFLPIRQHDSFVDKQAVVKSPSPLVDSKEHVFQIKTEEEPPVNNFASLIDPLNVDLDDNSYIDTKSLCIQIGNELKQHSIPQAVFAEKILCRSQGTLSDLLRNPKPWEKLKSGRETFRRMYNWMNHPLNLRLAILDMKENSDVAPLVNNSPPTPAKSSRVRQASVSDDGSFQSKRPRLVFTDIQKRTLQAIFKETQRPSREMQKTIAEHLGLDLSTVSNFFMNSRRRSRGQAVNDDLGGFEQTPPSTPKASQRRHNPSTSSSTTNSSSHINETVDAVIAGLTNNEDDDEQQQGPSNYSGDMNRSCHRLEQRIQIKSECESPPSVYENHM